MRTVALLAVVASACGGSHPSQQNQQLTCSGSDVPIYKARFQPQSGASGVASAPDAAGGALNSAPNASVPAPDPNVTAMVASCAQAPCSNGQVGVELPAMVGSPGTGGPAAAGAGAAAPSAGAGGAPVPADGTIVCADPPPACPSGESPQYTSKGTWECTDCSLVVTYGGIYGNYRRCVSMPHLNCPDGQTPTWVFEDDQWECKPTCDNGQYDQHTIAGQLVCVPC